MFVATSVYSKVLQYIDLTDVDAFKESLRLAKTHVNPDASKLNAPVVFMSVLSKQTPEESNAVPRSLAASDRARRKFIMLDVDFEPGDEPLFELLRDNFVAFAETHKTPALMYPTLSWPKKPRARFVLFTKRVMTADNYYKAVNWLSKQLVYQLTDSSDTRMSANRNLPWFSSDDQVDGIIDMLDGDELKPLDNKLWSSEPGLPKAKTVMFTRSDYDVDVTYDVDLLCKAIEAYVVATNATDYSKVWRLIESIADELLYGSIDRSDAQRLMASVASVAKDDAQLVRWATGNMELLTKSITAIETQKRQRSFIKPLLAYGDDFAKAVEIT